MKIIFVEKKEKQKVLFPNNTSRIEVDATIQSGNIQSLGIKVSGVVESMPYSEETAPTPFPAIAGLETHSPSVA